MIAKKKGERITYEQCEVLLNVFQVDNHYYMPRARPREYSGTNAVVYSRNIDMAVRLTVLKCYVWSTLLYGCEAWTTSYVIMTKKWKLFNLLIQKNVKNIMERQYHQ